MSNNEVRDATPEEQAEFDAMKLFVVVPAVIQIVVFFSMLAVFALNSVLF
jgi:hypothetical protein